jgi:hypothetical protein
MFHQARRAAFVTLGICIAALFSTSTLGAASGACGLEKDLARQVAAKYPGMAVATLGDLAGDDRAFFLKDHQNACPGLVNVDFYGDGKPTSAFLLVGNDTKPDAKLVVAHQIDSQWSFRILEHNGVGAALWSQSPGRYNDIYGRRSIDAKYPVIIFCKYEAWAIVYSWTGTKVNKVWISD